MHDFSSNIARNLLKVNAISLNVKDPFTWASGLRSPIYCDNRVTLSYPDIRNEIKNSFVELSAEFEDFDYLAGVATAGIAHGALLADALDKPFVYVRSRSKGHGLQNKIEGFIPEGSAALVVEDLISTGMSCINAVSALEIVGVSTVGVAAIFTYGFATSDDRFNEINCPYKTLTHFDVLLAEARKMDYIDEKEGRLLKQWKKNPQDWYKNHF